MGEVKDPNDMTIDEAWDALQAQLNTVEAQPQAENLEQAPPDGEASPVLDDSAQRLDGETPEAQEAVETSASPVVEEVAQTKPDATAQEDLNDARFAKLEAEIQRLRSENGRMRKIATENAMLRRRAKQLEKRQPQEQQRVHLGELTEDEKLTLGDDVSEVIKAKLAQADEVLLAMDERYRQQEAYLSEIRKREHKQARNAMMDDIERQYGEGIWDAIKTEAYTNWADGYDPLTGQNNRELLEKIEENADSAAAIAILGNFIRASGISLQKKPTQTDGRRNGTPTSANTVQRPVEPRGQTADPLQQKTQKTPAQWTVQAAEAAFRRFDRDPTWAQSKEGKAVYESIMNATLSGKLQL